MAGREHWLSIARSTDPDQTVADTGLLVAGDRTEVEQDPLTNQLRVVGGSPFTDVCSPGRRGHVEVLLRSKGLMAFRRTVQGPAEAGHYLVWGWPSGQPRRADLTSLRQGYGGPPKLQRRRKVGATSAGQPAKEQS